MHKGGKATVVKPLLEVSEEVSVAIWWGRSLAWLSGITTTPPWWTTSSTFSRLGLVWTAEQENHAPHKRQETKRQPTGPAGSRQQDVRSPVIWMEKSSAEAAKTSGREHPKLKHYRPPTSCVRTEEWGGSQIPFPGDNPLVGRGRRRGLATGRWKTEKGGQWRQSP